MLREPGFWLNGASEFERRAPSLSKCLFQNLETWLFINASVAALISLGDNYQIVSK